MIYSDIDNSRLTDNYSSDSDIDWTNEGYESDTDDRQYLDEDTDQKFTRLELNSARAELFDGVDLRKMRDDDRKLHEADLRREATDKRRLAKALQKLESKHNVVPIIENITVFTSSEKLDILKIYSESEIKQMRNHKYYKLADLLDNRFYSDIDNYEVILFAFKHESTINDNQILFMITDILMKKIGSVSKVSRTILIDIIRKKDYSENADKIIYTKFPAIQKIVKAEHPVEYDEWVRERKENNQRVRNNTVSDHQSMYDFIVQLGPSDYGGIKPTDLYNRYVEWKGTECETQQIFSKFLSRYGIKSKRYKTERFAYVINSETIKIFTELYNS